MFLMFYLLHLLLKSSINLPANKRSINHDRPLISTLSEFFHGTYFQQIFKRTFNKNFAD